jgi:hypothetical protein
VAQCVWWLASVVGLELSLENHIDTLRKREEHIHPDRVPHISKERAASTVPRDLTEDQRLDQILDSAEKVIQESFQNRKTFQQNRVNPLPTTKAQLKKARKAKNLQEARDKLETDRQERLRQIRIQVIKRIAKDD